jgi:hypothetical protein
MSFLREPDAEPIPGYRLIEPLGSGGFGEVWKCEAPGGLFKAIKFVYGNLKSLDGDAARAEQEFKAINRVKDVRHPFVLSMERIEVSDEGELVIVMELADKSLHDSFIECQAAGLVGIPRDDLLRYVRDAAEALDHMLEKYQLQHLDIKPRNLFLISDRVKVADFGLVKHLERKSSSGIMGGVTPLYAAPETFTGQISQHSDQYSLAIVYTELLTGNRPFDAKNIRQLAVQHMTQDPELRALPEAERPVIARGLAKDPAKRFPNCLAFIRALYQARMAVRIDSGVTAKEHAAAGVRPKTMAETMENIQLEQADDDDAVALDAPPPAEAEPAEVSRLGLTVAQPETGALRPTMLVGLGSFGRRALLELRCRFLDRFGELEKIPLLRFLYVDIDAEAVNRSLHGSPEVALERGEAYHLPLQPVGHYRRRMLDQLNDWLPREKLYALPRSLQTQGSRALGRLAFADNHLRFLARLKRELQQASHPDAVYQSVSQTGLALRDHRPRVYVFAAAGGGGSGLLVDLGYALRRLLQQLRHAEAEVLLILLCGAPSDPATPAPEQANLYATITELNHFNDPAIPFSAQYGADGPRIVDEGPPFDAVYLLQLAHRSPEALRDAVAHLGSYVFHDVTTPLGLRLDRDRRTDQGLGEMRFRSFGTYAVWFPRGLLLRRAAQQACQRLVEHWQAPGLPTAHAEVEAGCARALADPGLQFEALCARIVDATGSADGTLPAVLTGLLSKLEEQSGQSVAQDDPGNWARQALSRVQEWVGASPEPGHESDWQKSRVGRTLGSAVQKLAAEWDQRLADTAFGLMEHPGRRVAAAEAALGRFVQSCQETGRAHRPRLQQQSERTIHAWGYLWAALDDCVVGGGGFSFFGSRSRRLLRVFIDHLAAFSRQRLTEALVGAGLQFFAALDARLQERIRDLGFCRQRLRPLLEALQGADGPEAGDVYPETSLTPFLSPVLSTESYWEAIRQSATARVVLPEGAIDLEKAAARFVEGLGPDQWIQLDQALQDHVLASLGGLHHICATSGDLPRTLGPHLVDQAAACLGALLPITDVAQVEVARLSAGSPRPTDLRDQVQQYYSSAAPLVAGKDETNQEAFLLVPASDAGKAFGEAAKGTVPHLHLLKVSGQADLMFCREQTALGIEDLQRMLSLCRPAYDDAATVPNSSPHARFDITDWVPLDP